MKKVIFLSTFVLTACVSNPPAHWSKPGANQNDFFQDKTECEVIAARDVPVSNTTIPLTGGTTNCRKILGMITCDNSPGYSVTNDDNADLRTRAINVCLQKRGWTLGHTTDKNLLVPHPKTSEPPSFVPNPSASPAVRADAELPLIWPVDISLIKGVRDLKVNGINIISAEGNPVYAAASGKVVYAGNKLRGYGNMIVIKHNQEYNTVYAHNKTLLVKENDVVKQGDKIAEVGNTGLGAHELHFELRKNSKSVDPLKSLPIIN